MNKKFSIITINYNNLKGLKKTIESVINQTWKEFEYVVIDGGSTDGSAEYLVTQTENIDYWISEKDLGIYNAMNKGVKIATGEYLLFLNSGDHFFNNKILEQNHEHVTLDDLIYFNLEMIAEGSSEIINYPKELRFYDLYFSTLPHPATFIKKELFCTTGLYDENLKIVSDWKFFILALFRDNCSYNKINETFSTFYLDGLSSREDCSEERNEVLKEYFRGFILDYEELQINRNELKKIKKIFENNRFKILFEIEKSTIGKKVVSAFFRAYMIFVFRKET